MRIVHGDLIALALAGEFDVIVHGCNCQNTMGKGIALAIRRAFPEAFRADRQTAKGDHAKLGTIVVVTIVRPGIHFDVANAYTQFDYRGPGPNVDYDAVAAAFARVRERFAGRRIGYPRIGAGLAGGEWPRIAPIIDAALAGEDHTLVEYQLPTG